MHAGDIHELFVLDALQEVAPVYAARGNGEDGGGGRPVQLDDPRVKYAWLLQLEGLREMAAIGCRADACREPMLSPFDP
jgi:hypothetical protein